MGLKQKLTIKGTLAQIIARIAGLIAIEMDDTIYDCEIKQHREKRSLDANAYYWSLIGQYADWMRLPKQRVHNMALEAYGQEMIHEGTICTAVLPDGDWYLDLVDYHLRRTGKTIEGKDGQMLRVYKMLYGSHTYDSYEMSVLIDGLIADIQGSGAPIETMTPRELATLKGYSHEPQKA